MQVVDKWSFGGKEALDLTIVISEYESFENNIHDTVNNMAKDFEISRSSLYHLPFHILISIYRQKMHSLLGQSLTLVNQHI